MMTTKTTTTAKMTTRASEELADPFEGYDFEVPETPVDPDIDLEAQALRAIEITLELCRKDVNAFCEFVLRDEETTEPIEQLPFHLELHDALDEHRQAVILAHPESGKTNQIAIGRTLWKLGNNPNLRVLLLGNTQDMAKKSLSAIKKYIERSDELHQVFPELKRGDVWQDITITVQRPTYSKDPSVQALGYGSNNVQGSRVDVMVPDDFLSMETTSTEAQRRRISKWFRSVAMARCTEDCEIAFLTNAWHPRDLAHELVAERGWHLIKRPVRVNGQSVWPQRWPEKRIRKQEKNLGTLEFQRVFMCEPRDEGEMIFKPEFFARCKAKGAGIGPVYELETVPPRCVVLTAVDIGGRRMAGANSSIFTGILHPNGTRQPLWLESGRWGATELLKRIVNHGVRYKGIIAVENNGVQQHIVDLAIENEQSVVSIIPYHTGVQKADPRFGVASMSSEFEAGRWILPTVFRDVVERNVGKELEEWMVECLDYTPEVHTGDRLMASWIWREVGRRLHTLLYGTGSRGRQIGAQILG
jgi:hypothetical protein